LVTTLRLTGAIFTLLRAEIALLLGACLSLRILLIDFLDLTVATFFSLVFSFLGLAILTP
jgi:hypothetical protein